MSKFNELIKGETPVIVSFYADWAPTSDEVENSIKQLKSEMNDAFKMIKIDFDKNEAVARKLNVIGVPTVLVFKEGKVLLKQSGEVNVNEIKEKLI
jgi:thioredoxin 1